MRSVVREALENGLSRLVGTRQAKGVQARVSAGAGSEWQSRDLFDGGEVTHASIFAGGCWRLGCVSGQSSRGAEAAREQIKATISSSCCPAVGCSAEAGNEAKLLRNLDSQPVRPLEHGNRGTTRATDVTSRLLGRANGGCLARFQQCRPGRLKGASHENVYGDNSFAVASGRDSPVRMAVDAQADNVRFETENGGWE